MSVTDITLPPWMTVAVVIYNPRMSRWEPDARGRLMQAALELYGERGFDQTTVAEIAQRAGLTERTFFRHFADKREVLFSGEVDDLVLTTLVDAPRSATPMDAVASAVEAAGGLLEERRDLVRRRQAVIAANPRLRERELVKFARLASAMTDVLRRRGVEESAARLTADAGIAVLKSAFDRWIDEDNRRDFRQLVRESLDELRTVTAGGRSKRA
jgi:AcrR family transcriptional regulator